MNKHKKTILIVLGVMVMLVFLAAAVLLYMKYAEFDKARLSLKSTLDEQQRLLGSAPFPSAENIAQENDNLDLIRMTFAELGGAMRFGQVEPVQQAPAAFNAQFWKVQKELLALAKDKGINVPVDFAFGFQRHMTGSPPPHPDVPRLTQQLLTVSELTRLLYDCRIVALRDIFREEFEGGETAGEAGGHAAVAIRVAAATVKNTGPVGANLVVKDAGIIPEGSLYGRMHFILRFTARESALQEILNRLARDRMFIVVTRLEITGGETSVTKPAADPNAVQPGGGGTPDQPQVVKALTKDERLVCGGRETPVLVTIDLDVYRFRPIEEIIKQ